MAMERTRHVDVGSRIGQVKPKKLTPQFTFEEQELRFKARSDGEYRIEQANHFIVEACTETSYDAIPFLPGCWTLDLHNKVLQLLDLANDNCKEAERQFTIAGAKDKVNLPAAACRIQTWFVLVKCAAI
jgi:hypothetical protein